MSQISVCNFVLRSFCCTADRMCSVDVIMSCRRRIHQIGRRRGARMTRRGKNDERFLENRLCRDCCGGDARGNVDTGAAAKITSHGQRQGEDEAAAALLAAMSKSAYLFSNNSLTNEQFRLGAKFRFRGHARGLGAWATSD